MTEKQALSRVLYLSRDAYLALLDGSVSNPEALLNSLSDVLSHCDSEQPMNDLMKSLKKDIRQNHSRTSTKMMKNFSMLRPKHDYDFERALKYIDVMIFGNECICTKLSNGEQEKALAMLEAMRSMPGFILGDYDGLTPEQYYDLVFGLYPKQFGEPFMEEKREAFT